MKIFNLIMASFIILILVLAVRGNRGNPTAQELNSPAWTTYGPFELSPERGRFALTYSIVEDKSLSFSVPVARFATPDLGYINNKYVSLFAPFVSYLVAPGYIMGKLFGSAQFGTFVAAAFFAFLNTLLIKTIATRLGANQISGWLGGLVFVFATPAFAYAVNLYQHHISTFLILLALYLLIRFKNLWSKALVWFLCAAAIPVDYPNLFLMFPIALYALSQLITFKADNGKIPISINFKGLFAITTGLLPILFFLWFNFNSYGNPLQLSGTVPDVLKIDISGKPVFPSYVNTSEQKSVIRFFQTKNIFNGLYVHLISPDRGIIFFTPVVLIGLLGLIVFYSRMPELTETLASIIGINILLYSMWGDPWGGWGFGSRYLIPAYAILSILIALLISIWRNKIILFIFFILFSYSAAVNTLGAITSSSNPPQVEVAGLEKQSGREEKYTYARNWDLLLENTSRSFIYQTIVKNQLSALQYYLILVCLITLTGASLTAYLGAK